MACAVVEDLGRLFLAKAGEEVARLLVPRDLFLRIAAPPLRADSESYTKLVEGNLALFEARTALLGETSTMTVRSCDPGMPAASASYLPGTRIVKNARVTLGQDHRVTVTVNVEEMVLVEGRAYIVKLD
jgi:hypothetical protein